MEFFNKVDNKTLDQINLKHLSSNIISSEYQNYFESSSGNEHYRLLSYISIENNFETFIDIGTLKGCSALAFSTNLSNKVISFNLSDQLDLYEKPENIEFIIDDVMSEKYRILILSSKFILLDTYHDGSFEKKFYDYLIKIGWKGYLLLDDIHLNLEMKFFWNSIVSNKCDISHLGHKTGTGLVIF